MKLILRFLAPIGILATVQCGQSSTPMAPSSTIAITLATNTVAAGATTQGTVTLSTTATTATSVALSSSNTAVATVPPSIAIAAGATSATFAVTGVTAGSATISAALNGATAQSTLGVTGAASLTLVNLTLANASLTEGDSASGIVTLNGPAPNGGAAVTLAGTGPIIIASSVVVPAGATSAMFTFSTKTGTGATSATITATYGGASMSATMTIARPTVATARFGVTGPTETDTCEMSSDGRTLNCTFNASTSSAPGNIVSYEWTFSAAGGQAFVQTTTSAALTNPTVDCSIMPAPPMPAGVTAWPFNVALTIRDDRGNVANASNGGGARLLPMHACGF